VSSGRGSEEEPALAYTRSVVVHLTYIAAAVLIDLIPSEASRPPLPHLPISPAPPSVPLTSLAGPKTAESEIT